MKMMNINRSFTSLINLGSRCSSSLSQKNISVIGSEESPVLKEFLAIPPPSLTTDSTSQNRIPGLPSWVNRTDHFGRQDRSNDRNFYDFPRLVTHIDDTAINALTNFYRQAIGPDTVVLDLCTSWISHLPDEITYKRVIGVGMNEEEMKANSRLSQYHVHDLNEAPNLPFLEDSSCDHVLCCVSVDYLTQPYEVFTDINRVLKPGGTFIISFSNRCFFTKAIFAWLMTNDAFHLYIVSAYFQLTSGWEKITVSDLTDYKGKELTDPLYIVEGRKCQNES